MYRQFLDEALTLTLPRNIRGEDEGQTLQQKEVIMGKKMQTVYRVGYIFEDGSENWIVSTAILSIVESLIMEVWEEYGEKPVVKKERVKV